MKEMTETRGLEIRGQICSSHRQATCNHVEERQSCNIQSSKVRKCHSYPHTNYDNQMKSDTDIMLEDDQARENNTSSQMICNNEFIHARRSEQSWQNQNHYAKRHKMSNRCNHHVNTPNKHSNEVQKKQLSWNPQSRQINHHNQHINVPNEYNIRACIQ